jgi:hypothetical protein
MCEFERFVLKFTIENAAHRFPVLLDGGSIVRNIRNFRMVKNHEVISDVIMYIDNLGPTNTRGFKLVSEWVNCSLKEYGETEEEKQLSLRKTLIS